MCFPWKKLLLLLLPICLYGYGYDDSDIPVETDLYLQKQGFSLGYSYKYRQALWVAYTLTTEHLQSEQVRRKDIFKADPAVKKRPVRPADYTRTGYDKGHLAPAADMTYSMPSMENSFLMSNISPQVPGFNRGIWKRLETQVRRWAVKEEKIYILTGPVFIHPLRRMGRARLPVPVAFYKIIFDLTPPQKMIGFVIPNQSSKRRLASFAVSVDEIERITGYDFFSGLDDELENRLEAENNFQAWNK